jgi:hypothetical protein
MGGPAVVSLVTNLEVVIQPSWLLSLLASDLGTFFSATA